MFPVTFRHNCTHSANTDAEPGSQSGVGSATRPQLPQFSDCGLRKPRLTLTFSALHSLGVSVRPIAFSTRYALPLNGILHVLFSRAYNKVLRVHAGAVVAGVPDVHAHGNSPMSQFISDPMCQEHNAAPSYLPVTVGHSIALPGPAHIGIVTLKDSRPEACYKDFRGFFMYAMALRKVHGLALNVAFAFVGVVCQLCECATATLAKLDSLLYRTHVITSTKGDGRTPAVLSSAGFYCTHYTMFERTWLQWDAHSGVQVVRLNSMYRALLDRLGKAA